ncbi:unnamed protein product [Coffea canephora]|uniref:Uncharacterized protein n=1 Tax=Coffea canephora TaxID=49390 RepID=A0A068TTR9_COFCA|nr:unnamed protein product [Coffea canephora]
MIRASVQCVWNLITTASKCQDSPLETPSPTLKLKPPTERSNSTTTLMIPMPLFSLTRLISHRCAPLNLV